MSLLEFALASLVGGLILFVWGFLAWVVLPLHRFSLDRYRGQDEDDLREVLRRAGSRRRLLVVPGLPHPRTGDREKQAAIDRTWQERRREGPVALVAVAPCCGPAMSPRQMVVGLAIQILAAALATAVLALGQPAGYLERLLSVLAIGLAAWLAAPASQWNWFPFPTGYTLGLLVDYAIGWSLLATWLAWICGGAGGT